tara:strand:+ start:28 stop:288 length:261 start_codon:yes stop_codon:yes gene_type:complete
MKFGKDTGDAITCEKSGRDDEFRREKEQYADQLNQDEKRILCSRILNSRIDLTKKKLNLKLRLAKSFSPLKLIILWIVMSVSAVAA